MAKSTKISAWQLYAILLLSRLLTLLTYTTLAARHLELADYFPAALFAVLFITLCSVGLLVQIKQCPNRDLLDTAGAVSKPFQKAVCVCLMLYFFFYTVLTTERLRLFVGTVMFPHTETAYFMVLGIAAACYVAGLGLEALGRAGSLTLGLFVLSFLFVMLSMIRKIDLNYLVPSVQPGFASSLYAGWDAAANSVEILLCSMMLSKISKKPLPAYLTWLGTVLLSMLTVFFFVFGGLGDFALTQLFPIHAVAVLSEIGMFQRFDVLLTGIWILTALFKISFLLYVQADCIEKTFPNMHPKYSIVGLGGLLAIVQIFLSGRFTAYYAVQGVRLRYGLFLCGTVLLPGLVFAVYGFSKRSKVHENR